MMMLTMKACGFYDHAEN